MKNENVLMLNLASMGAKQKKMIRSAAILYFKMAATEHNIGTAIVHTLSCNTDQFCFNNLSKQYVTYCTFTIEIYQIWRLQIKNGSNMMSWLCN